MTVVCIYLPCIYKLAIPMASDTVQAGRDLQEERRKRAEIDAQVKVRLPSISKHTGE